MVGMMDGVVFVKRVEIGGCKDGGLESMCLAWSSLALSCMAA